MIRKSIVAASFTTLALALAPNATAGPVYDNCDEAHADGAYNIPQDDPAYWPGGDRDKDGYACDSDN